MAINLVDGTYYFNSHAHVERDRSNPLKSWMDLNFNSHAHVERDLMRNFVV